MNATPKSPTGQIGGGDVLFYTPIDERHRFTGSCLQKVGGKVVGPLPNLAIAKFADGGGFYLFGCDTDWRCVTDTFHDSIEDAKVQAEFEYEGTIATWLPFQSP